MTELKTLKDTVQKNCDISDARYAGNYSMCVFLLKMREYFRWEQGFRLTEPLPGKALGDWLQARERLWDTLGEQTFLPLAVEGQELDAFAADAINDRLAAQGLVYSAGYGRYCKPHFFLARLHGTQDRDGFRVMISGDELARDMVAPPAMFQGRTIYIRRQSIRRMLWEKIEEWQLRKRDHSLPLAMGHYPFASDMDKALDEMTDNELGAATLHEIGEGMAGDLLGSGWQDMVASVSGTRAEILARAVRDHLADCVSTLPRLIDEENTPSLHFFRANLGGMRLRLFPRLVQAFDRWQESGDPTPLREAAAMGRGHWLAAARRLVELGGQRHPELARAIEAMEGELAI